jgi:hypothetical protein
MRDVMNRNPMTVTGTPTLVAGPLTVDPSQGLQWNGTTNSGSTPDSASLSYTGSMSMELFLKVAAYPGSTQKIWGKDSSYQIQINSTGHLIFRLDNGGSNVTVTSVATIPLNTWVHVVCVYNGNYAGAQQFGKTTQGAATTPILGDFFQGSGSGHQNKMATKFTLLEQALLNSIVMDLVRTPDTTLNEFVRAHIYAGTTAAAAAKVAESADVLLSASSLPARAWVTFPIGALMEAGDYWFGPAGGESSQAFSIGCETSGGSSAYKNDLLSDGLSDPFGTPGSTDAKILAAYGNYTATSRTGDEGKALLYINGVLDNSAAYTLGIADNANALTVAPSLACFTKDRSVWPRVLKPVDIARHYTAR